MSNLLVTGCNGYLGSSFVKALSQDYVIRPFSLQNQELDDINFHDFDAVLHCAAVVHRGNTATSDAYRRVNIEYPLALARLAKANGLKQFVFISSVSVYGSLEYIDDSSDCDPKTLYASSKLEAEERLSDLNSDGFKVAILRFPMIYGPKAPGNLNSIIRLISYSPIVPLGLIGNKRSFIAIENAVYAIDQVLKQCRRGVFLLADDECISTSRLVSILSKSMKTKICLVDSRPFAFLFRIIRPNLYRKIWGNLVVNSSVAKSCLNLEFPVHVDDGVFRTVEK
tara:strand:- start:3420 stop:4265 length:846 start_codon:yes stop_codon:yes gene_type:complete